MDEAFFSGYCRNMDGSRMVTVERDGAEITVDCDYFCCPYGENCPIAGKIREFEQAR